MALPCKPGALGWTVILSCHLPGFLPVAKSAQGDLLRYPTLVVLEKRVLPKHDY